MKLHILGFSPPYPNKGRATSSFLLEAEEGYLLLDCGHGSVAKLLEYRELTDLTAIIISHMHPDHFYDLIPLRNSFFHRGLRRIPLYLPPGGVDILNDVVRATRLPDVYMTDYFELTEYNPDADTIIEQFRIQMVQTVHPINTYAMKFMSNTGSQKRFVYTSDTAWSENVIQFCQNADLLLIEATEYPPLQTTTQRWHLTPSEAGSIIKSAHVKRAVLTHYEERHSNAILACVQGLNSDAQVFLAQEHEEYYI